MQKANKTIQKDCVRPLLKWYRTHARDLPWRRTHDPYAIWISEIMLQQTQVATVIPYWERWMKEIPTIQALAEASEQTILKLWEGLGYYRRARMLQKAAKMTCDRYQGNFPQDHETILSLPGIGPYTAGAIASIAFDQPKPILDGNVIRVLTRYYSIKSNPKDRETQNQLWGLADHWVHQADLMRPRTAGNCSHLNQSIMELGATICLPGNLAQCNKCPLSKTCGAHMTSQVANLPNLPKRRAVVQQQRFVYVLKYNDRYLMQQKGTDEHNEGLWEFYNTDSPVIMSPEEALQFCLETLQKKGIQVSTFSILTTIKHTITHHRITLHCFEGSLTEKPSSQLADGKWVTIKTLKAHPMPSAHQKLRSIILG
jgi:A/G-specific adenine glycosylase